MSQAPGTSSSSSPRRAANVALLFLVPLAVFFGLFANTIGVDWLVDPASIHAALGIAVLALSPWKSITVRRGLRRRRSSRWVSVILMVLTAITLVTGFLHATDATTRLGPLTVMQIHVGAAVGALLFVVWHYRMHPVKPRAADLNRRNVVRATGMAAVSVALLGVWELGLDRFSPGGGRRFTGSHERSSFEPRGMPSTVWLDDRAPDADADTWTIDVDGVSLDLAALDRLEHDDVTAILDCTSGWYSEQVWTGVRLDRVVSATGFRSVEIRSSTGYARRFPARDLDRLWLVTRVGGEALSRGHGFPARIVAPGRRGFWWVKWVDSITTSERSWWLQSPFPVT